MSQSHFIAPGFGDCGMQPVGKGASVDHSFLEGVCLLRGADGADSILGERLGCQHQPPLVLGK